MNYFWIILVASVATVIPVAAIVLVSFASLREESAHSLGGLPPGMLTRTARRLLGYHSDRRHRAFEATTISQLGRASRKDRPEVRFAYARGSVSGPGQFSARGQSQPGALRTIEREKAGV